MIRPDLAVDQLEPPRLEVLDGSNEDDLRGVAHSSKHGFPEENLSDSDSVHSCDQHLSVPRFERMRPTEVVETFIGFLHLRCDPGVFRILARRGATPSGIALRAPLKKKPKPKQTPLGGGVVIDGLVGIEERCEFFYTILFQSLLRCIYVYICVFYYFLLF